MSAETADSTGHQDRRVALRDAALVRVRDQGAHALSLRAVARDVGVDIAAVYRYYRDKQQLLLAVGEAGFAMLSDEMYAATRGVDAAEDRLQALGLRYVHFAQERPELFRLMFGAWCAGRGLLDTPGQHGVSAQTLFQGAVRDFMGESASPEQTLLADKSLVAAAHGLAALTSEANKLVSDDMIRAVMRVVLDGLKHPS